MKFEIYTREQHCPHCIRAKEIIKELGFDYKEIKAGVDLSKEELIDEVRQRSGVLMETVPVVFIDDEFIGGRDALEEWVSRNEILLSGDDDLGDLDI